MDTDIPHRQHRAGRSKDDPAELDDEERKISLATEGLDYMLPLGLARSPQAPTNFPARGPEPLPATLPENLVNDRLQHVHTHDRDAHLRFDDTTHTYYWKERRARESVTQMIHRYATEFNPDQTLKAMSESGQWPRAGYLRSSLPPEVKQRISRLPTGPGILTMLQQENTDNEELNRQLRMALKKASPTEVDALQGLAMSSREVKRKWEDARDEAAREGTWMHAQFECLLNGGSVQTMTPEIRLLLRFLERLHHATAYRTEWKVYAEDIDVAGSIDFVLRQADGSLALVDWKRSSRIASRGEHFNRFMKPPLQHLGDSSLTHYDLQLNVYRWILQKHYHQVVTEMYIVGTHPDNGTEPWIQRVQTLDGETAKLIDDVARTRRHAQTVEPM